MPGAADDEDDEPDEGEELDEDEELADGVQATYW
jgi:hypothetical protein